MRAKSMPLGHEPHDHWAFVQGIGLGALTGTALAAVVLTLAYCFDLDGIRLLIDAPLN